MTKKVIGFRSEKALSQAFNASVVIRKRKRYTGWKCWEARELQGLFGVPDTLLVYWKLTRSDRHQLRTIALEMKCSKWQRALVQAYRYLAFADYSFVVMDAAYVHRAVTAIDQFKRANVGLISVAKSGEVEWHYNPQLRKPYSDSARTFLLEAIREHLFKTKRSARGPTIRWTAE